MWKLSSLIALVSALSACSEDPISFSAPVGINLKAESSKVVGMSLVDEKGITTESGNPYGAFVSDARSKLGRDPSLIELEAMTLTLGARSTGVSGLEQIYTGNVDVLFLMNDSNNSYPVGKLTNPTGTGPTNGDVSFESADVTGVDWTKYLGGGFKVVIRGTVASGFAQRDAKADLQVTFTFAAFE